MTKTIKIDLLKSEITEIIAYYFGVEKEKVKVNVDDDWNVFAVVEKELTFPEEKQTITSPYSPWCVRPVDTSKGPYDYPNPLQPYVTWTSDDSLSNRNTITTRTESST